MRDFMQYMMGAELPRETEIAFAFSVPIPFVACVAIIAAAFIVALIVCWLLLDGVRTPRRILLSTLRSAALALLIFLALDPTLIAREPKTSDEFVAVILDDSRSMSIIGGDGLSRADRLTTKSRKEIEATIDEIRETHRTVLFRLGNGVERIDSLNDLTFGQRDSALVRGVLEAQRELEGVQLSAAVLISDGVENDPTPAEEDDDTEWRVPVFTVGVGDDSTWRDLAIQDISYRRTNFDKTPVELSVQTYAEGLAGEDVIVEVIEEKRVIATQEVHISEQQQENNVSFSFVPETRDWVVYRARARLAETGATKKAKAIEDIRVPGKDAVSENNDAPFLVDNREKRYRVLYFSGRPNWENKFVARSLAEDDELQLSSLIRVSGAERTFTYRGRNATSANPLFEGFDNTETNAPRFDEAVFIRLGMGENELQGGYPADHNELFNFDLVIWGDIEHDFFSQGHLETTREFVAKRGGAFLMLGGPRAFENGGYSGSVIETMLPVVLGADGPSWTAVAEEPLHVKPTVEGFLSGAWTLSSDIEDNEFNWESLPPLYGPNRFPMVRTGATVWSRMSTSIEEFDGAPLFAGQRYGDGFAAALATGETWPWQMDLPNDDDRHERFWRQLVRTLVRDVPDQVVSLTKEEQFVEGGAAEIELVVRDDTFEPREGLRVEALDTPGEGALITAMVDESIDRRGVYAVRVEDLTPGLHRMSLTAKDAGDKLVAQHDWAFHVTEDEREFDSPKADFAFLEQIAEKSGGSHFAIDSIEELPSAIPMPEGEIFKETRFHLWWLPIFYAAIVMLLISEWYFRRRAGHA